MRVPPVIHRTGVAGATPLLLVHGLGSSARTWRPLLPWLVDRYDIALVDLPGHGATQPLPRTEPATPARLARAVARGIDALGWSHVHVVGNSLGGWVALELAAADDRVASVTGLAPAGLTRGPGGGATPVLRANRYASQVGRPLAGPLSRSSLGRRLGLASVSAQPDRVDPMDALWAARDMADATGYWAALDGTVGLRFTAGDAIHVPVTAVWGDVDHVLPAWSSQVRDLLPAHARWVVLPSCGHLPHWDTPAQVVDLLHETVTTAVAARA